MIQNFDLTQIKLESESKLFDDRESFALSNGVVKEKEHGNTLKYVSNTFLRKKRSDTSYFQRRITKEIGLLKSDPNNGKLLLRVGDVYLANKKYDKAKQYFNRVFRDDTENIIVARKLVEIYMVTGKLEKADQVLNLVLRELDTSTIHLHAVIKLLLNKLDESERLIRKISNSSKNFYEAINSLGLIYLYRGDYSEAEKYFNTSIKSNTEYAPAKNNLALSLEKQGKIIEAIAQYKNTLKDHHSFIPTYHNLFNLYASKSEFNEAYSLMDSARDLIKPDNEIQFRIAWSLMAKGDFKSAISEYEKVLELLPENSSTLNNIGHCLDSLGMTKEAYGYFKRAVIKSKKGNDVGLLPYRNLMVLSEKVGRVKEAATIANDILKYDPNDAFALVYKGIEHVENEEWKKANQLLNKAYTTKPPLLSLYNALSFIYADIYPDYDKGMEVCEYVLNNNVDRPGEILNNYIHLNLVNNRLEKAEQFIDRLNEENPISLATIGLYNLKKNDLSSAEKKYDKAIRIASDGRKEQFIQRKYYDLGVYYLKNNDPIKSELNLRLALEHSDGSFQYIKKSAESLLNDTDELT